MSNALKKSWLVLFLVTAGVLIFVNTAQIVGAETPEDPKAHDPIPSPAIITDPEHGLEAGFAIQVYSFQDKTRAETALENMRKNGYPQAYMVISDLGEKGTWYRVRVGGIDSEQKARDMLVELRKAYNGGFIVKPKK